MKSKQLANVLIKILGLSLCAQSVIPIVNGIMVVFANKLSYNGNLMWWSGLTYAPILVAIGIFLIVKSRAVAEFLFKGEDE
jgi:hypothetical protein